MIYLDHKATTPLRPEAAIRRPRRRWDRPRPPASRRRAVKLGKSVLPMSLRYATSRPVPALARLRDSRFFQSEPLPRVP